MHIISSIQSYISELGLFGVFLVMFIENLGIPFPTEVGFLITLGLINSHQITFTEGVIIIVAGHVCGAIIAYGIGRWGDKKLTGWFERNPNLNQTRQKVIRWYDKYGSITVFATRLIGYVRPWSSLVAGFARVPFASFVLWSSLGSVIFSIISLSISKYVILIWQQYPGWHVAIIFLMFLLFFGVLIYQTSKREYAKFHRK